MRIEHDQFFAPVAAPLVSLVLAAALVGCTTEVGPVRAVVSEVGAKLVVAGFENHDAARRRDGGTERG